MKLRRLLTVGGRAEATKGARLEGQPGSVGVVVRQGMLVLDLSVGELGEAEPGLLAPDSARRGELVISKHQRIPSYA